MQLLKKKEEKMIKGRPDYRVTTKWKQIIKENISNEMAQGMMKIAETHHVSIKLFWAICLVLANGLCFYLIVASFLSFFDYEVNTTSRRVFESPAPFPKVRRLFIHIKSSQVKVMI